MCVHTLFAFIYILLSDWVIAGHGGEETFMQCRKMHRKSLTSGMVEEGLSKINSINSSETTGRTLKYTFFECWKLKTTIRGVVIQEKWLNLGKKKQ